MQQPYPHQFRYSKCARQTFMCNGTSVAGRTKVYCKNRPYLAAGTFLSTDICGKPTCQHAKIQPASFFPCSSCSKNTLYHNITKLILFDGNHFHQIDK